MGVLYQPLLTFGEAKSVGVEVVPTMIVDHSSPVRTTI